MGKDKIVAAIVQAVHQPSVDGVIKNLRSPPGRSPAKKLLRESEWFNGLPGAQQAIVSDLVEQGVHAALFGFFCVLDGVSGIESGDTDGELILSYKSRGREIRLNASRGEMLHDMYQSIVQSRVLGE